MMMIRLVIKGDHKIMMISTKKNWDVFNTYNNYIMELLLQGTNNVVVYRKRCRYENRLITTKSVTKLEDILLK